MSSLDIVVNPAVISKIQGYFNDPSYKEMVENAAQFNSKLGAERTMRLPFLDSQTGVAQNHSNLFMEAHQRLPGMKEGQVYSYPSKRWQKKRRQYLHNFMQPRFNLRKENGDNGIGDGPPLGALLALENSPFATPGPSGAGSIPSNSGGGGPSSGGSGGGIGGGIPVNVPEESKEIPNSSKDPDITKQDWFYDELDVPDAGEFDEPDADSDYDYEESYSKRKKKKTPAKTPRTQNKNRRKITYDPIGDSEKPFACDLCGARYKTRPGLTYHYTHSHKEDKQDEEEEMDMDKRAGDEAARRRGGGGGGGMPPPVLHPQQPMPPTLQPQQPMPPSHHMGMGGSPVGHPPPSMMHPHHHHPPPPHLVPQQQSPHMPPHHQMYHHQPPAPGMSGIPPPGSYLHHPQQQGHMPLLPQPQQHPHPGHPGHAQMGQGHPGPPMHMSGNMVVNQSPGGMSNHPGPGPSNVGGGGGPMDDPNYPRKMDEGKPRFPPSPYCDFCLGDAVENKKSGSPEQLVSCSDCGRSGHPSCLQFTNNMIISVKKYRWQCIECKCCSLCGTSDNDDQLLFCDDCDRGYHTYCFVPKLDAPPEGSWSCTLCLAEFHKK